MNSHFLWLAAVWVMPALASPTPKALASTDWACIRAEYQRHRQAVSATQGGWQARNYLQQWTIRFDGGGFAITPDTAAWRWGLRL
ncbi:MAG: hypothetical protein KGN36_15365, partial [Acidobacteriota bacterium]|nr:hypothetical protein [Acidobacteriota bacterium]